MKRDISSKLLALWPNNSRLNNYITLISGGLTNPRGLHCGNSSLILIARVRELPRTQTFFKNLIFRVLFWAGTIPLRDSAYPERRTPHMSQQGTSEATPHMIRQQRIALISGAVTSHTPTIGTCNRSHSIGTSGCGGALRQLVDPDTSPLIRGRSLSNQFFCSLESPMATRTWP